MDRRLSSRRSPDSQIFKISPRATHPTPFGYNLRFPMQKYSFLSLARNALTYHENWQRAWRSPDPKPEYDVVIVGGGGHGLATAYYLVKEHRAGSVAVLEKGYVGGGNTGRNTEIVRSNYLWDEAAHIYEFSLKLWEGLTQEINFNLMFSQRGLLSLGHTLQDLRDIQRRINANLLNGIDSEFLTPEQIKEMVPAIDVSPVPVTPSWELRCNAGEERPATTPWRGGWPGRRIRWGWTSSRTAR